MKRINFFTYLLSLCVITSTYHFSDAAHNDSTYIINQFSARSSTQVSLHDSSIISTSGIFGIVPAIISITYELYKWLKSDNAHATPAREDTQRASQLVHIPLGNDHPERYRAELALHAGIHDISAQSYALDATTRSFLRMHKLDDKQYMQCTGNILEHALHAECVSLAHDTAHLDIPQSIGNYQTTLAHAIDAGRACVHEHDIKYAVAIIDWSHGLYRYLEAAIKGIGDGFEETVETFVHPYRTCKQLAHSTHEMVRYTLRMIHELGLIETLIDTDNDTYIEAYLDSRGHIIHAALESIKKCVASLSSSDATQKIAATVTQTMLTGKCLSMLLGFFTHAAKQAPLVINRATNALAQEKYTLALAVDSGALSIAQEAAQLSLFAADKHVPSSTLIGLAGAYKPLADELEHLRKIFAKYLLENDKTLIHLFEGEINKIGKLGGLHHDYLGYLETQGRIRVLEILPNGMYRAEVLCNGKWKEKSFFPKHWTREHMLEKIALIIEKPYEQLLDNNRFIIKGFIDETKVKVVLTQDRKIITCYPDIL